MVALVKITKNEKGDRLVSARELHESLEIKSKFSIWIQRRIEKYQFQENLDFTKVSQKRETLGGKQSMDDYIITLDMAKELSMIENNEKGRQIRKYFIQCEKQLQEKKEIKYNPRLMDIQDSVDRVAELEEQLRSVLTDLKFEYAKLEMKSKYMKELVETEGSVQFLEEFKTE